MKESFEVKCQCTAAATAAICVCHDVLVQVVLGPVQTSFEIVQVATVT